MTNPVSYRKFEAITPHDSNSYVAADAVYVGTTGTLTIVGEDGVAVSFGSPPAGTTIYVRNIRVNATGTSATNLVRIYV